jgi:hypothetical protein
MATIMARRRPIRDGAERSNAFNCRMVPIPLALLERSFRAHHENGPARVACRGHAENSNARVAGALIHSGFIAAFRSAMGGNFYRNAARATSA